MALFTTAGVLRHKGMNPRAPRVRVVWQDFPGRKSFFGKLPRGSTLFGSDYGVKDLLLTAKTGEGGWYRFLNLRAIDREVRSTVLIVELD